MAVTGSNSTEADLLEALVAGRSLTAQECRCYLDVVLDDCVPDVMRAALVVSLAAKSVTAAELGWLVDVMLERCVSLPCDGDLDIVGTGGDGHHTVNISTMTSLLVASAGVRIVKHGNRAASSRCGTADVLEHLGVALDLEPEQVAEVGKRAGITFAFAQVFHPSLKSIGPIRKQLQIRTPFNWFGPLCNPAQPRAYLLGVADRTLGPLAAEVLMRREQHGLVVHGHGVVDELTLSGPCEVWVAAKSADKGCAHFSLDAADYGLPRVELSQLRGGDATHNAQVVSDFVDGAPGPIADTVCFNAATAVLAQRLGEDLAPERLEARLPAALREMKELQESGAARQTLAAWQSASKYFAS